MKIKKLYDSDYTTILISIIFIFSDKSELSKLSNYYSFSKRVRLSSQVKKDMKEKLSGKLSKNINIKWMATQLNYCISAVELTGVCEILKTDMNDNIKTLSKTMTKTFVDKFGKDTSCQINLSIVNHGDSVMVDTFLRN